MLDMVRNGGGKKDRIRLKQKNTFHRLFTRVEILLEVVLHTLFEIKLYACTV